MVTMKEACLALVFIIVVLAIKAFEPPPEPAIPDYHVVGDSIMAASFRQEIDSLQALVAEYRTQCIIRRY